MNKFHKAKASIDFISKATREYAPSPYLCRVYLCHSKSADKTGYCAAHCSDLRPGRAPYSPGSAPTRRIKSN